MEMGPLTSLPFLAVPSLFQPQIHFPLWCDTQNLVKSAPITQIFFLYIFWLRIKLTFTPNIYFCKKLFILIYNLVFVKNGSRLLGATALFTSRKWAHKRTFFDPGGRNTFCDPYTKRISSEEDGADRHI